MKKYYLLFALPLLFSIHACDPENNGNENPVLENIDTPTTWTADKVWLISEDIDVNSDLTIEPGTVVKFASGASMYVGYSEYASVKALGTEDDPVLFTSSASDQQAGDWGCIHFYAANSSTGTQFTYCTFEYGGGNSNEGMIKLDDTGITMENCTVRHSASAGFYLMGESKFTSFKDNLIENCALHCINCGAAAVGSIDASNTITSEGNYGIACSGNLKGNTTWHKFAVPYFIIDELDVENQNGNVEWTIDPGVTIKCGPGVYIWIGYNYYVKITANGTQEEPITFTSSATSPSKGDWDEFNIGASTSSESVLNYCNFWYGGGAGYAAIYMDSENNTMQIKNSNMAYSAAGGIYIATGSPVMSGNTFNDNEGLDVEYAN